MTRKEAQNKIQELLNFAEANLKEAEKIADEHEVTFTFNVAYGMGGTYYPPKKTPQISRQEAIEKLASSDDLSSAEIEALREVLKNTKNDEDISSYDWESSYDEPNGWVSSSYYC